MGESDDNETTSRICLPAKVETQKVKKSLWWMCESLTQYRIMYVTLRRAQDKYVHHSDEESIEAWPGSWNLFNITLIGWVSFLY